MHHTCEIMDGVATTAPNPSVPGFPGISALLEYRLHTTPQSQLERLATLPLGERPPLVVFLESPESHIHVLWGNQLINLYFAQQTLEDGKVISFAGDIRLGLLPETLADMESLMARLAPGHPHLPPDTPRPDRVSVPWASLTPLTLFHLMMVSPFLAPATAWHMMHAKSDAMGMT